MISYGCPKCLHVVTGPEMLAGRLVKCPQCAERMEVPLLPGQPAPKRRPSSGITTSTLLVPALGGAALAALVLLPMMFFPGLNPFHEKGEGTKPARLVAQRESAKKTSPQTENPPKKAPEPVTEEKLQPKAESKADEPKREPKIEPKPEPKPQPKVEPRPKPKAEPDADIAALVKQLKSNKPAERVKAAAALAKHGQEAKSATAALIESMVEVWPTNKEEFLDALESINRKIHKPVLTLLIDQDFNKIIKALGEIQALGADGIPAITLLSKLCRHVHSNPLTIRFDRRAIKHFWL